MDDILNLAWSPVLALPPHHPALSGSCSTIGHFPHPLDPTHCLYCGLLIVEDTPPDRSRRPQY
jgi:hypothetical protein